MDARRGRRSERTTNQRRHRLNATPFDPAPTPDDYDASDADQPFKNGWQNIALSDGSWSPLRWRISHAGRVEVVGAIDGGALGTVCVTLPSMYRPTEDVLATISSTDGTRVMTVSINAGTGDITVVGVPASVPGDGSVTDSSLTDTGVTAGSYGDASHVATFTVNGKGRLTAAGQTAISIAESAVTGLVSDLATLTSAVAAKISATIFTTKGDILAASGSATPVRVGVGSDGQFLTADSTQAAGVKWAAGGGSSPLTTKGDLYGHSTVDARIPIGANGQVLTADSGQALGLKWDAIPGTGGDTLHTVASSGSSQTVDYGTADVWDITLTAACTISLTGFTNGNPDFLTLILRQDGTGSRLITWPTITWIGNGDIEPSLQTAPSAVDSVVLFSFDGGTTVFGIAQTSASGLRSGTSFPGSPSDGDLFYRTDTRILYEYDSTSTHWLSVNRMYVPFGSPETLQNTSTTNSAFGMIPIFEDVYVERFVCTTDVTTTTNGSNFWTVALERQTGSGITSVTIASFTTASDTASTFTKHNVSVASVIAASTAVSFDVRVTKTGTPGAVRAAGMVVLRTVG
jgi:hypothetical protein